MAVSLHRDGVKYLYWTVESLQPGLGPIQIRIAGTDAWLATEAASNSALGFPRYRKLFAGPNAVPPDGTTVITSTPTMVYARINDNPEIEIGIGRIDLI